MIETIHAVFADELSRMCAGLLALLAAQHQAGHLTDEQLATGQAAVREHIAAARAAVARALGAYIQ